MPRYYRQYLRDMKLDIPRSTRRYRTAPWPSSPTSSVRRRTAAQQTDKNITVGLRSDPIRQSEDTSPGLNDEDPNAIERFDEDPFQDEDSQHTDFQQYTDNPIYVSHDVLAFEDEDPVLDFRVDEPQSLETDSEQKLPNNVGNSFSGQEGNESLPEPETLHTGTDVTRSQFLLLMLSFILRHKLSGQALSDLLQLLNLVMPNCLPKSKYLWEKLFKSADSYVKHYYCSNCSSYFGTSIPTVCLKCTAKTSSDSKDFAFFLIMPLATQIVELATSHKLFDKVQPTSCSHKNISDVCCGQLYKQRPLKQLLESKDNISLTWSCDGVPLFSSSKYSIWPVICTINELPYHLRRDHTLLFSLWFGKTKPHITSYLKPFVDELGTLARDGVHWRDEFGHLHNTKVFASVCSCDSVARAMLQNFTQFNGLYGCSFCLHPGEVVEKGSGHVRVYPISTDQLPNMRTDSGTKMDAGTSVQTDTIVNGVKGPSVLMLVPHFNIVDGFSPDYMHSVLLGVVRHFVYLWLDSSQHRKAFYLGPHLNQLNMMLEQIKPPREITRRPRNLVDRKYWKASEWRHFLLIYSGIILRDTLAKSFYHHWLLLVNGVSLLMKSSISPGDLESARLCLLKFVVEVPRLYGQEHVSFNTHLLTHLPDCVKKQGPLWATSTFVFEDAYGKLQNLYHGTQHVMEQMFKSFFASRELARLAQIYLADANDEVKSMYTAISQLPAPDRPLDTDCFSGVGRPVIRDLRVVERLAIEEHLGCTLLTSRASFYKRFVISGKLYTTEAYTRPFQRNDSVVIIDCLPKKVCTIQDALIVQSFNGQPKPVLLVHARSLKSLTYVDSFVGKNLTAFIGMFDSSSITPLQAFRPTSVDGKFVIVCGKFAIKLPKFELD